MGSHDFLDKKQIQISVQVRDYMSHSHKTITGEAVTVSSPENLRGAIDHLANELFEKIKSSEFYEGFVQDYLIKNFKRDNPGKSTTIEP